MSVESIVATTWLLSLTVCFAGSILEDKIDDRKIFISFLPIFNTILAIRCLWKIFKIAIK